MKKFFASKRMQSYLGDPSALVGSTILFIFFIAALFASILAPMDPYDLTTVDLANYLLPPSWMDGGLSAFPLGTDDQGRGILSTILYGLRTSLLVSITVVTISSIVGVVLGMLGDITAVFLTPLSCVLQIQSFLFLLRCSLFCCLGFLRPGGFLP